MTTRRTFLKYSSYSSLASCLPLGMGTVESMLSIFSPDTDFFVACMKGDLELVKTLLIENPALRDQLSETGLSGYAIALLGGHLNVASFLKEAGYKSDIHESALALDWERFNMLTEDESNAMINAVNAHHPMGGTAMWAAATGGAGSQIWRVYAKSADPNLNTARRDGTTPLQQALRYHDLHVAEMTAATLLGNDAQPGPAKNADLPPLHIAALRGSSTIAEMLIRLGANPEARDGEGKKAIEHAQDHGHTDVEKMLRHHDRIARTCRTSRAAYTADGSAYVRPDISDIPRHLTRRFVGNAHGNLEYVVAETEKEPRMVHSIATTNEKCVEACAHTGRLNVVNFLVENGAPYSLPTAVVLNDHATVKRYLDEDPNRIHERGAHDFALMWYPVIGRCDLDMMQLLIDRGAKVEEQHFLGTTALHWAASRGPVELVEMLVENGADVNRVGKKFNEMGERPLQRAKDEKIIDFLKSKGAVE